MVTVSHKSKSLVPLYTDLFNCSNTKIMEMPVEISLCNLQYTKAQYNSYWNYRNRALGVSWCLCGSNSSWWDQIQIQMVQATCRFSMFMYTIAEIILSASAKPCLLKNWHNILNHQVYVPVRVCKQKYAGACLCHCCVCVCVYFFLGASGARSPT